ncbi:hypothetical protein I3843_01G100000 [Carya illinoinensis]|nr:hypothetical protein I3843_01G100000 [Carya illinoinensis]
MRKSCIESQLHKIHDGMAEERRSSSCHGNAMWDQLVGEFIGTAIPSPSFEQLFHALLALVWPHSADTLLKTTEVGPVECQICCSVALIRSTEVKPSMLK